MASSPPPPPPPPPRSESRLRTRGGIMGWFGEREPERERERVAGVAEDNTIPADSVYG